MVRRGVLAISMLAGCCCLMAGCGGGPGGTSHTQGAVAFTIRWPAVPAAPISPALIPQAVRSIGVQLSVNNQPLGAPQLAPRPAGSAGHTEVRFDEVPIGKAEALAIAYPNPDGTGVPLARGEVSFTVQPGATTRATLVLDSTIVTIEISPSPVGVQAGQEQQLTATARDADGHIVLTSPGALQWDTADHAVATVDQTGKLIGVSPGTTRVIVTDSESGRSGAADVTVSGLGPGVVHGVVTDTNNQPLANVTVATTDGATILSATTNGLGQYTLSGVPAGSHAVSFAAPGYLTQNHLVVIGAAPVELNAVLESTTAPPPEATPVINLNDAVVDQTTGLATITGTITGLDTGSAVLVQNGQESLLAVTDGAFEQVVVLQTGTNLVEVRATNAAGTTISRTLTINYTGATGEYFFRVTLTWDQGEPANRADMDLHVWSPTGEHCYFAQKTITSGSLDVDNTSGFGPENFTCTVSQPGLFRVAVNYYSSQLGNPIGCVIRVTTGTLASNSVNQLMGPHSLTAGSGGAGLPLTADTASWWRACDVELSADGQVTVRPADTSVSLAGVILPAGKGGKGR